MADSCEGNARVQSDAVAKCSASLVMGWDALLHETAMPCVRVSLASKRALRSPQSESRVCILHGSYLQITRPNDENNREVLVRVDAVRVTCFVYCHVISREKTKEPRRRKS